MIRKAIIPAAGLGTRFLPATKAVPKEMIPVVDKPSIQYIVEEAAASGIQDILIITGRNKQSIEDHFDKAYELEDILEKRNKKDELDTVCKPAGLCNVHFIRQQEAKGLGHAVLCAKSFVGDEPFAILLGDDLITGSKPCLKQMIDEKNKLGGNILATMKVSDADVEKYGIVDGKRYHDRIIKVSDMVEKPSFEEAPSNQAIIGRYILDSEIFSILEKTVPGKGGEIQLTDAIKVLMETQDVYAYEFIGKRYDTGDKLGYLKATVEFALNREEFRDEFYNYLEQLMGETP
ncbi:UTP--glucose-1-phosphate uridylyltransferase GalU [Clostridia bacterium]|nr:UTP--glucose-1-phosphate uridylyltransferase GalU [Clostridia bacterium]